jgi:hypothetical protein
MFSAALLATDFLYLQAFSRRGLDRKQSHFIVQACLFLHSSSPVPSYNIRPIVAYSVSGCLLSRCLAMFWANPLQYFLHLGHGNKSYGSTPSHLPWTGVLPPPAHWPIFPSSRTVILFTGIQTVTTTWKPSLETRLWVRREFNSIQKRENLERCHPLHLRDFFPWSQYSPASSWCYRLGPFI